MLLSIYNISIFLLFKNRKLLKKTRLKKFILIQKNTWLSKFFSWLKKIISIYDLEEKKYDKAISLYIQYFYLY